MHEQMLNKKAADRSDQRTDFERKANVSVSLNFFNPAASLGTSLRDSINKEQKNMNEI